MVEGSSHKQERADKKVEPSAFWGEGEREGEAPVELEAP